MRDKLRAFGIVFDLDGTLIDSTVQISKVMNESRMNFGHPAASINWFQEKIGLPARELLSDLNISPLEKEHLIAHFREALRSQMELGVPVYRDTESTLEKISAFGAPLGIATSKPTELAQLAVAKSVLSRFNFTVQGTDGFSAKPNPEVILRCVKAMKIERGVYVGDRVEDIQAGKGAGLITVGVTQGIHSTNDFIAEGANLVIKSLSEIIVFINQIFR